MLGNDIANELKESVWRLFWATVVLYLVFFGLIFGGWLKFSNQGDKLNRETSRTTNALCVLRSDLQVRVNSSLKFLADHPRGIPGIPATTIKQGVDGQLRTIKALSRLDC